jgi:5'(3')-deoxyribonucleotidase
MSKIVAIDTDGVIADLHSVWLDLYNKDYNDNLKKKDIVDWEIHNFVKSICGIKIYDYLRLSNLYDMVKPIKGSLSAIRKLRSLGHRIIFPTSCVPGSWGLKYEWLIKNKFIDTPKDYMEVADKSLVRANYLIDDYWGNLDTFKGYPVLFSQPWNIKYQNSKKYLHANNWEKILEYFV